MSGFLLFLLYFALGLGLWGAFAVIYAWITPHDEVALIKENNAAAATAYAGALLGFVLPVASVIANAVSLLDCLIWGAVAGVVQVLAFWVFRRVYPKVSERLQNGEMAIAVKLAGVSIGIGILNAASLTY